MSAADICRRNITKSEQSRAEETQRNREVMPVIAELVEETRQLFGDGVRVRYAKENGRVISRNPLGEYA